MNKYIFLDIDGVLIVTSSLSKGVNLTGGKKPMRNILKK